MLEARFQDGELRFDAIAGLEVQELQHRVSDRRLQVHQRIAFHAFRNDAAVFFLLRLAGKTAQRMKLARAPQPGIGVPRQPVLVGHRATHVARRRTGILEQPLDNAVLHQAGENKD